MSFRFPPDVRLRSRREFVAVQERGRRVAARYLTMLALPNTRHHHRLGLVASRRIGGAVVRNRAKRRLREVFRQLEPLPPDPAAQGYDLVVIARREAADAPMPALAADFRHAMRRLIPSPRPRS